MAGQWIIWVHDSTDKSYREIIGNRYLDIYIIKKQIIIYIYIYPLNNCSIETYVQSYWRSCLLLTRRLSSTHVHHQLWINNLLSPSDQIISLPKQLEFQKFVPIFFVVSWPFCQDHPCSLAPSFIEKPCCECIKFSHMPTPGNHHVDPFCWFPNLSHQPSTPTPPNQPFLRSSTKAAKDGNRIWKEGLRWAGSCDTLGKSLLSKTCFFSKFEDMFFWISLRFDRFDRV